MLYAVMLYARGIDLIVTPPPANLQKSAVLIMRNRFPFL